MAHHERAKVEEAVAPNAYDIAVASDAILAALAGGRKVTQELFGPIAERLASEPIPQVAREIEGVQESDVRRVRAAAATMIALAHLEARGAILPLGPHHYHHSGGGWNVPARTEHYKSGYNIDGPYNFGVAEAYVLPPFGARAPVIDSPALFLSRLPASMGKKVRRVLVEAIDAYSAGLYFASAVLVGVASEAAWGQVAVLVDNVTGNAQLRKLLQEPRSAGRVQQKVVELVRSLSVMPEADLRLIDATEQTYRDVRNYAAHRPDESFEEERFARAAVGLLLEGAVEYFRRLYELHDAIAARISSLESAR